MRVKRVLRGLYTRCRRRVRGARWAFYAALVDRPWDRRCGVETQDPLGVAELAIPADRCDSASEYMASPTLVFRHVVRRLELAPCEWTLVELGSGKGRVVLMAAQMGFRSVIGVELSPRLHEVAQRNLLAFPLAARSREAVKLLCMDAAHSPPPEDTVYYLYNPFDAAVLSTVLDNVERAALEGRVRVRFAYVNPEFASVVDGYEFLRQVEAGTKCGERYTLWATTP